MLLFVDVGFGNDDGFMIVVDGCYFKFDIFVCVFFFVFFCI